MPVCRETVKVKRKLNLMLDGEEKEMDEHFNLYIDTLCLHIRVNKNRIITMY